MKAPPLLPWAFSWFFLCSSCKGALPKGETILCEACQKSLLPAPPLCSYCASPVCLARGKCTSPWYENEELPIRSYAALYLLIEPGYSVLKAWKKSGGALFDERILRWTHAGHYDAWEKRSDVIVPIPQKLERSWQLGRSPAGAAARFLSRETGVPVQKLLLTPHEKSSKRQAQRSAQERVENPLEFRVLGDKIRRQKITSVILVDDFVTSGRTIKAAAQTLKRAGVRRVDVFCVGFRPRLAHQLSDQRLQDHRDLREGGGRAIAIG